VEKYAILLMVSEEDMMDTDMMDTSWIEEYENEDNSYEMFYPNALSNIKVNVLYINKRNELEKVHEKMIYLSIPNLLKKEELIRLIKDHDIMDTIKYKLVSLLVYNVDIQHHELKNYLYGPEKYDFITSLRNIEDYELKPSLKYLEKVNNIYIVFSQEEDKKETDNTIKKIRTDSNGNITDSSNNNSSSSSNNNSSSAKHKNTKRVKFNLGHKKTKRRKH
jgi:hypothetical protein